MLLIKQIVKKINSDKKEKIKLEEVKQKADILDFKNHKKNLEKKYFRGFLFELTSAPVRLLRLNRVCTINVYSCSTSCGIIKGFSCFVIGRNSFCFRFNNRC